MPSRVTSPCVTRGTGSKRPDGWRPLRVRVRPGGTTGHHEKAIRRHSSAGSRGLRTPADTNDGGYREVKRVTLFGTCIRAPIQIEYTPGYTPSVHVGTPSVTCTFTGYMYRYMYPVHPHPLPYKGAGSTGRVTPPPRCSVAAVVSAGSRARRQRPSTSARPRRSSATATTEHKIVCSPGRGRRRAHRVARSRLGRTARLPRATGCRPVASDRVRDHRHDRRARSRGS